MKRPDEKMCRTLANLKRGNNLSFDAFVKWVESLRIETETQARVEKDDVVLRWLQGRAQALQHIAKSIQESEELMMSYSSEGSKKE